MRKAVFLLGTMDTKGHEFGYVKERILTIAVGGMVTDDPGSIPSQKPLIGLTLHGDLMRCMEACKCLLEKKGYEVVVFAAVGSGGKSVE